MLVAEMTSRFGRESALVDRLLRLLPRYLGTRAGEHLIAVEVGVGRAIADVVAVLWDDSIRLPTTPLSARDSVVLAALRRFGPTRVDLLEQRCGFPRGALRGGVFRELIEWGLLDRGRGGRVALLPAWTSAVRVVAIEAKLTDWRAGIAQAHAYLRYADESYVALPHLDLNDCVQPASRKIDGDYDRDVGGPRCGCHDRNGHEGDSVLASEHLERLERFTGPEIEEVERKVSASAVGENVATERNDTEPTLRPIVIKVARYPVRWTDNERRIGRRRYGRECNDFLDVRIGGASGGEPRSER